MTPKFPFTLTQAIIVLQFVIIGVMASFIHAHQTANESVDRNLAEESFNQRIMIQQLQECINKDASPCDLRDFKSGKILPRQ